MALNALMNVYTATGDAAAAAAVLEGMQQRGPAPNDISFNTAIAAHAQARREPRTPLALIQAPRRAARILRVLPRGRPCMSGAAMECSWTLSSAQR
jgi:pentatricopeptide repeat protein